MNKGNFHIIKFSKNNPKQTGDYGKVFIPVHYSRKLGWEFSDNLKIECGHDCLILRKIHKEAL